MFTSAVLPVPSRVAEAIARAVDGFRRPGTWWSGAERAAIVGAARHTRDTLNDLPEAAVEAAESVALAADEVTAPWIDDLIHRSFDRLQYVEIVGVVSRVVAVDTYARGIGAPPPPIEDSIAGEPVRDIDPDAVLGSAWVPMTTPSAPSALSAVPAEHRAQEDLHTAFYLGYREMGRLDIVKGGLTRAQMELLASRTSLLNRCFY